MSDAEYMREYMRRYYPAHKEAWIERQKQYNQKLNARYRAFRKLGLTEKRQVIHAKYGGSLW